MWREPAVRAQRNDAPVGGAGAAPRVSAAAQLSDRVGAKNVTIQYSIDADPIGQQFAAHTETGPYTWYNDLFANAHNRCPLAKANTEYIDNAIYDYQAGSLFFRTDSCDVILCEAYWRLVPWL